MSVTHHTTPLARWIEQVTVVVIAVGLGLVIAAPIALSAGHLMDWARDRLGLSDPWTWAVPVSLDAAAVVCVALTFHAALKAKSAGAARLMVWVLAGGSAFANARYGLTVSPDAAAFFGLMPVLAALLLEIVLKRARLDRLEVIGATEPPLPRYRMARWLVAPLETTRAWRTAVREGITNPNEALERVRGNPPDVEPEPIPDLPTDPAHEPEALEVAALSSQKEQILRVFEILGELDGKKANNWLARRGIATYDNYCKTVENEERKRRESQTLGNGARPALTAPADVEIIEAA